MSVSGVLRSKTLMSNLKTNNEALRMSNEKLREFAYVVSHDLKAPLRKASTYLDLIREKITVGHADAVWRIFGGVAQILRRVAHDA